MLKRTQNELQCLIQSFTVAHTKQSFGPSYSACWHLMSYCLSKGDMVNTPYVGHCRGFLNGDIYIGCPKLTPH